MHARKWGLIAAGALVLAAALLAVNLILPGEPEAELPDTASATGEPSLTPSPPRAATPIPDAPFTYTVQAGDTLSAIAQQHDVSVEAVTKMNDLLDPDVLQVGQVLIIPENDFIAATTETHEGTAGPSLDEEENAVVPPTLTPSGPPLVEIVESKAAGDLETESIALKNTGGMVSLENWVLSGAAGDQFVFPALTLFPEGEVRVFSTGGDDTPRALYWGRTEPAWDPGELVTLRDAKGNVVDTFIVPQ